MRCLRLSPLFYSVLLLIFLAMPGTLVGQQGTPAVWTADLSMKLKNVGGVRVSPDVRKKGKDDSRWVDEDVKMNRLYVVNLGKDQNGTREPRKLTEAQK